MLSVSDFAGGYRHGVCIVDGISITLGHAPVTSIVGSNGGGKTTLLRGICGLLTWQTGVVELDGKRLDRCLAHDIARSAALMVPSGRGTVGSIRVVENLQI